MYTNDNNTSCVCLCVCVYLSTSLRPRPACTLSFSHSPPKTISPSDRGHDDPIEINSTVVNAIITLVFSMSIYSEWKLPNETKKKGNKAEPPPKLIKSGGVDRPPPSSRNDQLPNKQTNQVIVK